MKQIANRAVWMFVLLTAAAACSGEPAPLEIELIAQDIAWDNTEFTAQVGQQVIITVTNEGVLDHNLVIESLGIDVKLVPGQTEVVEFTAQEPGVIDFICNVPGHLDAGMVGTITVNP